MNKLIVLYIFVFSFSCFAGDIKAPFGTTSSKVLPKGIRNLSFKGVFTDATEKYGPNGNAQLLADPFFKNITFGEMIYGTDDIDKKAAIETAMNDLGYDKDTKFAESEGRVEVRATVTVPVFAIGITDKITAAIAVPIVRTSLNVDTSVNHTDKQIFSEVRDYLIGQGVPSKADEIFEKLSDPVGEKLSEYGYEPLQKETKTLVGDIKLVGKFKTWEDRKNLLSVQTELTLPTGREASVNEAVDLGSGDGQVDIGVGLAHEFYINKKVTVISGLAHTVQLADTTTKRVPNRVDSKLTPDIDTNISRNLGDLTKVDIGLFYNPGNFTFSYTQSYQMKKADEYKGCLLYTSPSPRDV